MRLKLFKNKKVLLRERKRHTACRVASTPYVVLTGYPPRQGTPPSQCTPMVRVPPWPGYPSGHRVPPWPGYPPARVPPLARGVPPGQGTPPAGPGRVPPLPHGILGNVAKHYGIRVPPSCPMAFWEMLQSIMRYGYPPPLWTDRRTDTCQNITFTSYYVRGW